MKSNDFGYGLSTPLSRLQVVYNHGRQKFIVPALVLMLAFTGPVGDSLTASRFETSYGYSHSEAAKYCTRAEATPHSDFQHVFNPPEVSHFDKERARD